MLRAGVSLPALMKLLGHRMANMTLRYVETRKKDLQREFSLARSQPRHLLALPVSLRAEDAGAADVPALVERIGAAMRALELFRSQNPALPDKPSNGFVAAGRRCAPLFKNSPPAATTKNRPGLAGFVNGAPAADGRVCEREGRSFGRGPVRCRGYGRIEFAA